MIIEFGKVSVETQGEGGVRLNDNIVQPVKVFPTYTQIL
jgi:hypothetical protein